MELFHRVFPPSFAICSLEVCCSRRAFTSARSVRQLASVLQRLCPKSRNRVGKLLNNEIYKYRLIILRVFSILWYLKLTFRESVHLFPSNKFNLTLPRQSKVLSDVLAGAICDRAESRYCFLLFLSPAPHVFCLPQMCRRLSGTASSREDEGAQKMLAVLAVSGLARGRKTPPAGQTGTDALMSRQDVGEK